MAEVPRGGEEIGIQRGGYESTRRVSHTIRNDNAGKTPRNPRASRARIKLSRNLPSDRYKPKHRKFCKASPHQKTEDLPTTQFIRKSAPKRKSYPFPLALGARPLELDRCEQIGFSIHLRFPVGWMKAENLTAPSTEGATVNCSTL